VNILLQNTKPSAIAASDQLRAHAVAALASLTDDQCAHLAGVMLNIGEHPEFIRRLPHGDLIVLTALAQVGLIVSMADAKAAQTGDTT
jgi:hypothetical protein